MTRVGFDRWFQQNRQFVEIVQERISGDETLYKRMNVAQVGAKLDPRQEKMVNLVVEEMRGLGVKPDYIPIVMYQNYVLTCDLAIAYKISPPLTWTDFH